MKTKLTELGVARLKPPQSGRLDVWDSTLPAFGLRITATGARSYVVALRRPGAKNPSRIKVGDPSRMALADARAEARELMADPAVLYSKRQTCRNLQMDTVATMAAEYAERHLSGIPGAGATPSRCSRATCCHNGAPGRQRTSPGATCSTSPTPSWTARQYRQTGS